MNEMQQEVVFDFYQLFVDLNKELERMPAIENHENASPTHPLSSKRRVLMMHYYFPPHNTISVFRALRFIKHLPEFGWKPIVLTTKPESTVDGVALDMKLYERIPSKTVIERIEWERPEDKLRNTLRTAIGLRGQIAQQSEFSRKNAGPSCASDRTGWKHYLKNFAIRLGIFENVFSTPDDKIGWVNQAVKFGVRLVREHDVSAIFATGPPFSTLLAASDISRRTAVPMILDFRDPWTRSPMRKRQTSRLASLRADRMERACVAHAKKVILNTPFMTNEFRSLYENDPDDKFITITNGIDVRPKDLPAVDSCFEKTTRRKFKIIHAGTLYGQRNPIFLLRIMAQLIESGYRVSLELIGDCDETFQIHDVIRKLKLKEHVAIIPRMPHADVISRMKTADAFLLYQPNTKIQIPGKLFEMIPFRKPIIAIVEDSDAASFVRQYKVGKVGRPGNLDDMFVAFQTIIETGRELQIQGEWEKFMHDFNGRKLTQHLAEALDAATQL